MSFLGHIRKTLASHGSAMRRIGRRRFVNRNLKNSCLALNNDSDAASKPTVLFFAPEAGIRPHFAAHCLIARTLQELGYRVLMTRCHGQFSRCVVYDGFALPVQASVSQQHDACVDCSFNSIEMTNRYGLESIYLGDVLNGDISNAIEKILNKYEDKLESLEHEGIKMGEICAGETARNLKINDASKAGGDAYRLLRKHIQTMLLSYFALQELSKRMNISRLVFFNEYAVNLGAALAARSLNIPTVNMTQASFMSVDRRKIVLIPDLFAGFNYHGRLDEWDRWRSLSLPASRIRELMEDLLFRMMRGGCMVYSPTRRNSGDSLSSTLKLSKNRKLLVAFTSSLDEIRAEGRIASALGTDLYAHPQPFENQIEWLKALTAWVEKSPDLQLVVRVHPREGPNKREKGTSEHLKELLSEFSQPREHVRFVWPQESISSYDLIELADVGLISWSTLGFEMARVGIPVVAAVYRYTAFPAGEFIRYAPTKEGYFGELQQAIQQKPNIDSILASYRWLNLMYLASSVDVGDVVPRHDFVKLPSFKLSKNASWIEESIIHGKRVSDLSHDSLYGSQNDKQCKDEREMLAVQLRRCIRLFCSGKDLSKDYVLEYHAKGFPKINGSRLEGENGAEAIIHVECDVVRFQNEDGVFVRHSPLVKRIAPLCAQIYKD